MWFRDDVAQLLSGVEQACMGAMRCQSDTHSARMYTLGYVDALNAVRQSFGIPTVTVADTLRTFTALNGATDLIPR